MAPIISKPVPPTAGPGNVSGRRSSRKQQRKASTPQEALRLALGRSHPIVRTLRELWKVCTQIVEVVAEDVEPYVASFGKLVDRLMQQSAHVLEAYCCLDFRRYAKGQKNGSPPLQGSLPVLFVLFLLMLLYNAFVFAYMPAAGIPFNSPTSLIFHAFVFLVLSSFVQAVRTDPGGIPQTKEWRTQGFPPEQTFRERKRDSGEPRWCRKSEAYKPDRAHYCRVLKRAVLRMDHHCPWLGNTVGWANHKFFFLFLMYANGACGVLQCSVVKLLVQATLSPLTTFLLLGAEGLTLILSSILLPFFTFHCWLLARNMTTIEFCERMRSNDDIAGESRYDVGAFANIASVMGENPLLWFIPVGGPTGDGISFHVKGESCLGAAAESPDLEEGSASRAAPSASPLLSAAAEADALEADQPEAAHPERSDACEQEEQERVLSVGIGRVRVQRPGASTTSGSSASGSRGSDFLGRASPAGGRLASVAEEEGHEDASDRPVLDAASLADEEMPEISSCEGAPTEDNFSSEADVHEARATTAADEANCFIAWMDPEEFREDLQIGCEYIGETLEDSLLRLLGFCTGRRRRRALQYVSRAQWRRRAIRIVPTKKSAARGSQDFVGDLNELETNSTVSNGGGSMSGADFFSD